jgi:hypothetical protein
MHRASCFASVFATTAALLPAFVSAAEPAANDKPARNLAWYTDYADAMVAARTRGKMMFVFLYEPGENRLGEHFESTVLGQLDVGRRFQEYVLVKLPVDAKIVVQGKEVAVREHPALEPMRGRPGVAILDFAHRDADYYGAVVSAFPFTDSHCYSFRQMSVILQLPPGTLDERARVYIDRASLAASTTTGESLPVEKQEVRTDEEPTVEVRWYTDYAEAVEEAKSREKMLLLCFCYCDNDPLCRRFHAETLGDPMIRTKLQDYVCAKLPLGAEIPVDGKEVTLLEQAAFAEMLREPGVAILDFAHHTSKHYGCVVSTFPITGALWYDVAKMAVILDLPSGSLTQRTLIYAVRTHPDRPASTAGEIDEYLLREAESHSQYQARIHRQGHHQWETRFHRINARLASGLTAREVCAESWPGEHLVEAAVECVRCWRFSAGHWSAVRAWQHVYGYDIKRGSNGIWYATGIFGGH